jgi:hypothetical protein
MDLPREPRSGCRLNEARRISFAGQTADRAGGLAILGGWQRTSKIRDAIPQSEQGMLTAARSFSRCWRPQRDSKLGNRANHCRKPLARRATTASSAVNEATGTPASRLFPRMVPGQFGDSVAPVRRVERCAGALRTATPPNVSCTACPPSPCYRGGSAGSPARTGNRPPWGPRDEAPPPTSRSEGRVDVDLLLLPLLSHG